MSGPAPGGRGGLRLAANVSWMFADLPFLERPAAAARAGFGAVECHYPYDTPAGDLRAALAEAGVPILGINTAVQRLGPGDTGAGALPGHEAEAKARFDEALDYLRAVGGRAIHVKPGEADAASPEAHACFVAHLRHCAGRAAPHGVTLLIEPLNTVDSPGYFLRSNAQAAGIVAEAGAPALRLMFDLYHMRMDGADVLAEFARHRAIIGHLQFAGIAGRHEPDAACLSLLARLKGLGHADWMAAEYRPSGATSADLGWMARLDALCAAAGPGA